MKKILIFLSLLPMLSFGQLKISQLTDNTAITGAEVFPLAKGGSNYKETFDTLKAWINSGVGTVTSVGLTMPSGFSVANSPVTGSGTIAITGAGSTAQYIRGDGSLATYTSADIDTSVGFARVTGWSGGSPITPYYTSDLVAAVGSIDSGYITVNPGTYSPASALSKDGVVWEFKDRVYITPTGIFSLFAIDAFTKDVIIRGKVNYYGRGSFVDRHYGPEINLFVEFNFIRSTGDTCVNTRWNEDTLKIVDIKGHIAYCDSFPTFFVGCLITGEYTREVDSTYSLQKSGIRFDINGNGAYQDRHANITIKGGTVSTGSATEYAFFVDYWGKDETTNTFHLPFKYLVARTRGTKAFKIGHLDITYHVHTNGTIYGQVDIAMGNGEAFIGSDFVGVSGSEPAVNLSGFKLMCYGSFYNVAITLAAGTISNTFVWFYGYIRKSTLIVGGSEVNAYLPSDITKTAITINSGAKVYQTGYLRDTSGVTMNSGGYYWLGGIIQGNSNVGIPVKLNGGTFEMAGNAKIRVIDNSSTTYDDGIWVAGNATFIHNGGSIVVPAAGKCITIDTTYTLTVRNYNNLFATTASGGLGTYTETITGGGTIIVDADVQ